LAFFIEITFTSAGCLDLNTSDSNNNQKMDPDINFTQNFVGVMKKNDFKRLKRRLIIYFYRRNFQVL